MSPARLRYSIAFVLVLVLSSYRSLCGGDAVPVSAESIRDAISRAIPSLEQGSRQSVEKRRCFTCHNQALPVLALSAARSRNISIDENNFKTQLDHTLKHLKRGEKSYREGRGQGGKVITAGYALWTLSNTVQSEEDITSAVTDYLLSWQRDKNHWAHPGSRPPSSGSPFTATYVALRGLANFGTEEQATRIELRRQQVADWLKTETPKNTEDRVFQLLAFHELEVDDDVQREAALKLIGLQQEDGGWSQTTEMTSDAYATGTVLTALLRTRQAKADESEVRNAARYLLDSQKDDGSWHVRSRAKPFQTYYESGFPHGKDQFISITASAWSVIALTQMLPEKTKSETTQTTRFRFWRGTSRLPKRSVPSTIAALISP